MTATPYEKLETYRRKRDFAITPEPDGSDAPAGHDPPVFVVQKHAAGHLHYDFRIEIGGVLVSFSVPKGPSLNPKDRRLAVQTEDHPLAYADFEGEIPEKEYGSGHMIIWDAGTYENLSHDKQDTPLAMDAALESGRIRLRLHGQKLKGAWSLNRMKVERGKPQWLLSKTDDEYADTEGAITEALPKSIRSGRTVEELQAETRTAQEVS